MNFKFEVNEDILIQKKSHHYEDLDDLFCSFVFTSREWKHLEKYAVFWNRRGKSTIRYLGRGLKEKCTIPKMVLNDLFFYVQVYANDSVKTRKTKVFTSEPIHGDLNHDKHNKRMLNRFFEEMENKIDNIVYEDNKLLIYANNTLVESIDLVDDALVYKVLQGNTPTFVTDMALSPDSDLPIANKAVYNALQEKIDISSLATVALTGSYNDLIDIPTEFNPSEHTHNADDITNLGNSVDENIDDLMDQLINEF